MVSIVARKSYHVIRYVISRRSTAQLSWLRLPPTRQRLPKKFSSPFVLYFFVSVLFYCLSFQALLVNFPHVFVDQRLPGRRARNRSRPWSIWTTATPVWTATATAAASKHRLPAATGGTYASTDGIHGRARQRRADAAPAYGLFWPISFFYPAVPVPIAATAAPSAAAATTTTTTTWHAIAAPVSVPVFIAASGDGYGLPAATAIPISTAIPAAAAATTLAADTAHRGPFHNRCLASTNLIPDRPILPEHLGAESFEFRNSTTAAATPWRKDSESEALVYYSAGPGKV